MNNFYKEKQDIINWLDKYNVSNYTLVSNKKYGYVVNVAGNVEIRNHDLEFIPVKFNYIDGNFDCENNSFTSLQFAPSIVKGYFDCSFNNLTSLKNCPKKIKGNFVCHNNKINSINYLPDFVGLNFWCHKNPIFKSLSLSNLKFKEIYQIHLKIKSAITLNHKLNSNLNEKLNIKTIKNKI